jgi:O-acetylserine/cysteine efflux transporter
MRPSHLALMLLIDVVWAMNLVAMRYSVDAIPPVTVACLRLTIVALVLLPWLRWLPGRMGIMLVTAIVGGALFFGLTAASFAFAENLSALAIAGQLGVPFSLLLGVAFLGERIRLPRVAAILLSFAGIAVIGFDPALFSDRIGLGLTVVSSMVWAISSLLFRKLTGVAVFTLHAWLGLLSVPVLLTGSLLLEPGALATVAAAPPWHALGWIMFSALGSSILGYGGMTWLLQRYPISTISPMTLAAPLLSVVIATLWFETPMTTRMAIGGALTLLGVAIIVIRTAQAHRTEPTG